MPSARFAKATEPIAAFGVGGYAAGPMLLATWLNGMPNVIFEPNAEPGLTNKVLAKFAKRIATGYEVSARAWGSKSHCYWLPGARRILFDCSRASRKSRCVCLVTGGSQGALPINRAFIDAMDLLAVRKNELQIVHQTGERDYNVVQSRV